MVRAGASSRASCTASAASESRSTGCLVQRPLLVEPGQQQQVLDEQAHPGGFLLDPLHDPVQVVGGERRLSQWPRCGGVPSLSQCGTSPPRWR